MATRRNGRDGAGAGTRGAGSKAVEPDLAPRSQPVQQRSRDTVELILSTTAELLDEVGVDSFNTNLLAERAGVRVRTVYRYFPNKLAIITALAGRLAVVESSFLDGFATVGDPGLEWRKTLDALIDGYMEGAATVAGLVPIRRAIHAMPELRSIEEDANRELTEGLARALRKRGVRLPRKRMLALARTLVETTTTVIDLTRSGGADYAKELTAELKLMHRSYLANYLD
jgi:AcrR family transcriptional regulator